MQDHRYSFEVDGTPEEVWSIFLDRGPVIEHADVRIEILNPGDEAGNGLVRTCWFRVPKYLLSGGRARSWEWLTECKPYESWRYDAIGKPLWSRAAGWTRLEPLDGGRTRVHFRETYEAFNPVMRVLLEKRVHQFISGDNDKVLPGLVNQGIRALREKRANQQQAV